MTSRRIRIALVGIVGIALLSFWGIFPSEIEFGAAVKDGLIGETTPKRVIADYADTVALGDVEGAMRVWELPDQELPNGRSAALRERRRIVTHDLLAAGISERILIREVEWWRTCCEPGVITTPGNADGARILVQLADRNGAPMAYLFDVFRREGGRWVLRDVYPPEQEPLFWRFAHQSTVRELDSGVRWTSGLLRTSRD